MKGRFLVSSPEDFREGNIYADKSAVVLDWLLRVGINKKHFSLREVAKERKVSLGLVQRVFKVLVLNGVLRVEGVRTAKRFCLVHPKKLLKGWLENYQVLKKCKIRTYQMGLLNKEEAMKQLKRSGLDEEVAFALHSAADAYKCKNTNLETLELYLLDVKARKKVEAALELEPQERGYAVLLMEPYYKELLKQEPEQGMKVSSPLLTFLDLYHFPLRGIEQAEYMAQKLSELRLIYRKR